MNDGDNPPPRPILCLVCKVPCKLIIVRLVDRFECPKCREVYALLDGEPVRAKEH